MRVEMSGKISDEFGRAGYARNCTKLRIGGKGQSFYLEHGLYRLDTDLYTLCSKGNVCWVQDVLGNNSTTATITYETK